MQFQSDQIFLPVLAVDLIGIALVVIRRWMHGWLPGIKVPDPVGMKG